MNARAHRLRHAAFTAQDGQVARFALDLFHQVRQVAVDNYILAGIRPCRLDDAQRGGVGQTAVVAVHEREETGRGRFDFRFPQRAECLLKIFVVESRYRIEQQVMLHAM